MCVNLVVLCKLCEKSRCFPGKFTQLAQILHDRRSRQISTLHATCLAKNINNSNITRLRRMVSNVFLFKVLSLEWEPLRNWHFCVLLSPYLQEWRFIWEFFKWMQADYWTQVYWQTLKRPNVSFWCHNLISSIITFLRSCLLLDWGTAKNSMRNIWILFCKPCNVCTYLERKKQYSCVMWVPTFQTIKGICNHTLGRCADNQNGNF